MGTRSGTSGTTGLEVDYPLAATMTRLLSMFAELPSTPDKVADEAAAAARDVAQHLPYPLSPPGPITHRHGHLPQSVTLDRGTVVSGAGLLGLIGAMPSTPPDLRSEAEDTAEVLWGLASDS